VSPTCIHRTPEIVRARKIDKAITSKQPVLKHAIVGLYYKLEITRRKKLDSAGETLISRHDAS
jgi:hypothetical protein